MLRISGNHPYVSMGYGICNEYAPMDAVAYLSDLLAIVEIFYHIK